MESIIAFFIILAAQVYPVNFRPVRMSADETNQSWEEATNRSEFVTFNHRGKLIGKRLNKK
jgi:hypothetical protein